MARFFLLLCLLMAWPNAASAGVRVQVLFRPYFRTSPELCYHPTTQIWTIIPARQIILSDSIGTHDSLFVNEVGQVWRMKPKEAEVLPLPEPDSDLPSDYQHPDPDFGPAVLKNPNYTVIRRYRSVEVSSYNSERRQTDSTPWEIRNNFLVRFGDAACNFLPRGTLFRLPDAPPPFNTVVFRVEDTMNGRYSHRIDLWLLHVRQAENWGVKKLTVEVLGPPRGEAPR